MGWLDQSQWDTVKGRGEGGAIQVSSSHESSRRVRALAVLALAVGFVASVPSVASGYPVNHPGCDSDTNVTWKFVSGAPSGLTPPAIEDPWTGSMKSNVRNGFDKWEATVRFNGNDAFSVTEQTGTVDFEIYSISNLTSETGWGGLTACADGFIAFDFRKNNGQLLGSGVMKGIATHEMGHAIGINHTGYKDSHYNPAFAPTMEAGPNCTVLQSTPVNTYPWTLHTLEDDDHASALRSWAILTSGGPSATGDQHLRHSGFGSYFHNTVRLYDPANGGGDDNEYRTALRIKEPSDQQGTVRVEVWRAGILLPATVGSSCGGQFYYDASEMHQDNLNAPQVGAMVKESEFTWTTNPTTVWSQLIGGPWVADASDGVDFQIRVYNLTEDISGPLVSDGTIYVDTVYIQECWIEAGC